MRLRNKCSYRRNFCNITTAGSRSYYRQMLVQPDLVHCYCRKTNYVYVYASRLLSKSESKYAPIELECLAIVFAMNKFDQYIFGHPNVTIHTDHRSQEAIMNKSLRAAPMRIQAMMLAVQRFAFTVTWKPGK